MPNTLQKPVQISLKEKFIQEVESLGFYIVPPMKKENREYVVFQINAPLRNDEEEVEMDLETLRQLKVKYFNNTIEILDKSFTVSQMKLERQGKKKINDTEFDSPSKLLMILHLNVEILEWNIR